MYQLKNGLLYHDDTPVFALGQSYYPSYHPQKVPILEDGDRLGEMRKDLQAMKEAGFHLVRMAALGDIRMEGEGVAVDFPLPDAFCELCGDLDLAAMIRLQGYSMNLRGFADADMIRQDGEAMPFHWSWFLRASLHHPGILEDNEKGTAASAAHFADFPSVVSFQIYNEPAYPNEGFYDYHPYAMEAYGKYLEARGLAPEDPPRRRPNPGEDPMPWVRWRLFCMDSMSGFLVDMGQCAHRGYDAPENLTCHMSCPATPGAVIRGQDYFATAQGMDILGITAYIPHRGPSYHLAGLQLAMAESAAATFGKHTWLIEYNARTNMPPQEWQRETYAAIGQGLKGILYYQWRADYPFADGPEPEGFGLLYNDGRHTPVLETAVAMNRLVNRLGAEIAAAQKVRSGLAMLYSNHANAYADALENGSILDTADCRESSILSLRRLYTQLSAASVPVDFARACDLRENALGIQTLLLPTQRGLSQAELDDIDAFAAAGGRVYTYQDDLLGFVPYVRAPEKVLHGIVIEQYDLQSLLDIAGITPPACIVGAPCADARMLQGEGYALCCVVNYDPLERPLEGAVLQLQQEYKQATVYSLDVPEEGVAVECEAGCVRLPVIRYGAIIRLTR